MRKKSIILLVGLLLINLGLKGQEETNSPLSIEFETIAVSRCHDGNGNYTEIYGQIRLTNQTDSVFMFWIKNCSWTDLIIIEPEFIILQVNECDANYRKKISLERNQILILNSNIEVPTDFFEESINKLHNENLFNTFKIGFILIEGHEYDRSRNDFYELIEMKKDKGVNILWTKPINIGYSNYKWKIE